MGKQPAKKNAQGARARGKFAVTYIVKGKKFSVPNGDAATIAAHMRSNGYTRGTQVRFNGQHFELSQDAVFGDWGLVKL